MTKYPNCNKRPKYLKRRTKEQVLRTRKIIKNISTILIFSGLIGLFLFSGTRIECELPWGLLIISCLLSLLGAFGLSLLADTNGGKL